MSAIRKTTSVHEKTVKKVAKGEIPTRSRRGKKPVRHHKPIDTSQIHPLILEKLNEDHIHASQIEPVETVDGVVTKIVIHNPKAEK